MKITLPAGTRGFAVADWHLGHHRIIELCDRPFRDTDEMLQKLVAAHNAVVRPDDWVFVLGDVSMRVPTPGLVSAFNGYKILVAGNHDACWVGSKGGTARKGRMVAAYLDAGFDLVVGSGVATGVTLPSGQPVVLSHLPYTRDERYPAREIRYDPYRAADDGIPLVCGHVHDGWALRASGKGTAMINVGVDVRDYRPTSFAQIDRMLADAPIHAGVAS